MKKEKQNKYDPRQYWKDKIGFDSKEELLIYQYLCGNINKKDAKQLNESEKFQEYKMWRQHVEKFLEKCDIDELEEFSRFAKSNARICDNDMGMHAYLALPLGASIIGGAFIPQLFNLLLNKNVQMQQYTFWESVALLVISALAICIVFLAIFWLLLCLLSGYINSKNETVFWADYLEIIEAEMSRQKKK